MIKFGPDKMGEQETSHVQIMSIIHPLGDTWQNHLMVMLKRGV